MKELEELTEIIKSTIGETRYSLLGLSQKQELLNIAVKAYNKGVSDSAENAKTIGHSCGDPMTCGCQGNCDHPFFTVNKQSILKLLIP